MKETKKVIIIGSGIGGLGAGYWLSELGYEVEILEKNDRPGGRMKTLEYRGDKVDVGTQFYHSDYKLAFDLIDAAGLTDTKKLVNGKMQYLLEDGSSFLYDHRIPYMKILGLRGNLKLYAFVLKYVVLGHKFDKYWIEKDIPEYDNIETMDLFNGTTEADQNLRDYLITMISMGENMGMPEWMSLYHFIHLFRLTSFTNWIGLKGGVASLADELARMLPIQYEAPVRQIVMEKGRAVGVQMESDGSVKRAGHVIVAADPAAAARLLPDELEEQRSFFDSVIYSPFPTPVFFLDRPLRKDVWVYINDLKLRRPFMMSINQQAKMPEMCPSGKAAFMVAAGHPKTLDLIDLPDDEIIKLAQEDMGLMVPGFSGMIEEVQVFRHPFGIARYPKGAYRQVLDFRKQAEKLKGVSFVSDLFGGCYVEATLTSAKNAVNRVCGWGGMA